VARAEREAAGGAIGCTAGVSVTSLAVALGIVKGHKSRNVPLDFLHSILRLKELVILRKIREEAQRSGASKLTLEENNAEVQAAREERRRQRAS